MSDQELDTRGTTVDEEERRPLREHERADLALELDHGRLLARLELDANVGDDARQRIDVDARGPVATSLDIEGQPPRRDEARWDRRTSERLAAKLDGRGEVRGDRDGRLIAELEAGARAPGRRATGGVELAHLGRVGGGIDDERLARRVDAVVPLLLALRELGEVAMWGACLAVDRARSRQRGACLDQVAALQQRDASLQLAGEVGLGLRSGSPGQRAQHDGESHESTVPARVTRCHTG